VKLPADRVDDRHKLARLAEAARVAAPAPPPPARRPAPRAYRVLVVEDNAHVVEMYEYALRKLRGVAGAEVIVEYASNGHDAMVRLEDTPRVDLVLADLYMPVMDGFSLVERVKCDPDLVDIPILVISAGGADARARALDLGADVYLQKPVQFADILSTVRTLLRIGG
jgi:CheY-like chemotaxis protein